MNLPPKEYHWTGHGIAIQATGTEILVNGEELSEEDAMTMHQAFWNARMVVHQNKTEEKRQIRMAPKAPDVTPKKQGKVRVKTKA